MKNSKCKYVTPHHSFQNPSYFWGITVGNYAVNMFWCVKSAYVPSISITALYQTYTESRCDYKSTIKESGSAASIFHGCNLLKKRKGKENHCKLFVSCQASLWHFVFAALLSLCRHLCETVVSLRCSLLHALLHSQKHFCRGEQRWQSQMSVTIRSRLFDMCVWMKRVPCLMWPAKDIMSNKTLDLCRVNDYLFFSFQREADWGACLCCNRLQENYKFHYRLQV